jgi:hypothetical protein
MGPPRERRKITATTRDIESRNDSEQLSEPNPVNVPDSVSPNTNQIRANQTVLSNNTNNDNQSSTLLNIDYARLAREIVRLQAGPTSTNVTTPVHSVPSTTIGNSIDHRDNMLSIKLWKLTLESVQQLFPGNTDVDCIGIVLLASLVELG